MKTMIESMTKSMPHSTPFTSACTPRRKFLAAAVAATATLGSVSEANAQALSSGAIRGFDHVAFPMQNTDAMLAFYRRLGCHIAETASICSVYIGDQMINFHRPSLWQNAAFTLKAPQAKPPCGDLCFVWDGTPEALKALLEKAQGTFVEGPVPRQGGRRKSGSSTYVRDPDGNLLEFIIYP